MEWPMEWGHLTSNSKYINLPYCPRKEPEPRMLTSAKDVLSQFVESDDEPQICLFHHSYKLSGLVICLIDT